MRKLKLSTRTFLLSFVPACLLLLTAFLAIHRVTHDRIKKELADAIYESGRLLDRTYADLSRDRKVLLGKLTDSAGLKASVGLLDETRRDPVLYEQARATVQAQLAELQESSLFSYIAISDANQQLVASLPLMSDAGRLHHAAPPTSGLAEIDGSLYELQSVPIEIGGEKAATLTVGRNFDLNNVAPGGSAVLLKDRHPVRSTFAPGLLPQIISQFQKSCSRADAACELNINGQSYVVSTLQSAQLGNGYRLLVFRSLDASLNAFSRAFVPDLVEIGLCGMALAFLCTLITSRSVTRPLLALSSQLKSAAESGELPETLDSGHGVPEIDLVATSFNRVSAAERRSRNELVGAKRAAEVANRLKTEFLNNVSHELKTPVNGIAGMAELMTTTGMSDEQQEYVDTIQSCSMALIHLINEILDFSELETGRLRLHRSPVDVSTLLDDISTAVRASVRQKPISVEVSSFPDLPVRCLGDEKRIRQVLMHLCENAVKYTEKGLIRIAAGFAQQNPSTGVLTFTVEDSGIGVEAEHLEFIFEAFTQLDGSSTRQRGGTGVGLSIVKDLVGLMGGRFGVDSALSVGSKFWFSLPVDLQPSVDVNHSVELSEVV
jgi:signal transduction histidine kinase